MLRWTLAAIIVAAWFLCIHASDSSLGERREGAASSPSGLVHVALDGLSEEAVPGPLRDEHIVMARHLLALPALPKTGLNSTNDCNNKLCYYLESALSCKALNFGISKICARYLLGYLYGCDAFPAPSELFDAPSTCLPELIALLPASAKTQALSAQASGKSISFDSISPSMNHTKEYLASNFSQNCRRRCFQRYITQANTFYSSCNDQLLRYTNKTNQNNLYPIVYQLENYQFFKNQICVENTNGQNCYDTLAAINPVVHPNPKINILTYDCNYFKASDWSTFSLNSLVLSGACSTLGANGCCLANQVSMIAQSQTNSSASATYNKKMVISAVHMFPPCLMNYLSSTTCPSADLTSFCNKGANGNLTTFTGVIKMNQAGNKMPNMYDENAVLTLQGVISYGLLPEFDISRTKAPVLQVEIIEFAYYNSTVQAGQSTATQLTPVNGSTYFPPHGDYTSAVSGMFRFQFVVQGISQEESDSLYSRLTAVGGKGACSPAKNTGTYDLLVFLYGGASSRATCTMESSGPTVLLAEPLSPTPSNAAGAGRRDMTVQALSLGLVLTVILGFACHY